MKPSFSTCLQSEKFGELSALAAVGELNAMELEYLRQHLAECPSCSELYQSFADITANDFGVAAVAYETPERFTFDDRPAPELQNHLREFRDRLTTQSVAPPHDVQQPAESAAPADASTSPPRFLTFFRSRYGIAAAALLLLILSGGLVSWRLLAALSAQRVQARHLQSIVDSLAQNQTEHASQDADIAQSLRNAEANQSQLQQSLAASDAKNQELLSRAKADEDQFAAAVATAADLRQKLQAKDADSDHLAKLQQESDSKLKEALQELYQLRQQRAEAVAKTDAHDEPPVAANTPRPASTVSVPASSPSEYDARTLFGARDLHIVDVYDVGANGQNKRTYGRVYYVEKKLLVFYAFDLQDHQNHKRGVFQAWGYRDSNSGKPLDLGLFEVDDRSTSRWVLTVNRPDILSHIDAVFVTVEPPGGSAAPQGKKVLYANLLWPPNHP